ncbi:MAG: FGGY-family carbohydrate kinase [Candidatus Helarchaeota archaeon]
MSEDYLMAIDAGTGGSRCLIFNTEGELISLEYSEWKFENREDLGYMAKEFNADTFWEKIITTIKLAIQNSKIDPKKIRGISATSYREGVILLDENGKELYSAPADDMRALSQGMDILQKYGDKIYKITGRLPPFLFASAKISWFKEKRPEIYKRIHMLLMMNDWIIYKLSGKYSSDPSSACETELFDVTKRIWSKELIQLLDLPENIYPPIYNAGTQVGEITKEVAIKTGLVEGTPVVVGGGDSECCLLGMGLINEGDVGIITGTTTPIQMVIDKPIFNSKKLWTNCHLIPGKWNIEANSGPSGKIFRWLRDTLSKYEYEKAKSLNKNPFTFMDELVRSIPPGSNGCFAFLGPMICDWSEIKPLGYGGFLIPLPIDPEKNHAKGQILRSYLENMAYVLKLNCDQIEEISGIEIKEINISGGLTNSSEFNEIVVNTINRPIKIFKQSESTGLGAAICASIGAELFDNFENAIDSMSHLKKTLLPDKKMVKIYRKGIKKWKKFHKILEKMN